MSGYDQSSIAVPMPTVTGSAAALGGPYRIKPSEAFSGGLVTISGLTGETINFETSPDYPGGDITGPRTNLAYHSEDTTFKSGTALAPTALTLQDNSGATALSGVIFNNNTACPVDTNYYTCSVNIAKGNEISVLQFKFTGGTQVQKSMAINTATGEMTASTSADITTPYMVEDYGSYWKMSWVAQNNGTAQTALQLTVFPTYSSVWTYPYVTLDVAAQGTIGITKAQYELTPYTPILFMAEGDSITASVQSTSWPNMVGLVVGSRILNTAVGSTTTTDMVTRYNTYKTTAGATHFGIMGGVNDLAASTALSTIKSNLLFMWQDAKARGRKVVAFTVSPWKGSASWDATKQTATETLNDWIRLQSDSWDVLVDAYTLLGDAGDPASMRADLVKPDLIHPYANGQKILADKVRSLCPELPKLYTPYIGPTTTAALTKYDSGVWATLTANAAKGNGIHQIDMRGALGLRLVKSAASETATVNVTLKRDALQYINTAGTWSVL